MRWGLAFRCFFRVLFGKPLPEPLLLQGRKTAGAQAGEAGETGGGGGDAARAEGAVTLLRLLQREGRLVDFLREDIEGFSDEQVGAAVRRVHAGARAVLERYVRLEPVIAAKEGELVTIEREHNAAAIELTGNLGGGPPWRGVLQHHGYRAAAVQLPASLPGAQRIVAAAEVEVR